MGSRRTTQRAARAGADAMTSAARAEARALGVAARKAARKAEEAATDAPEAWAAVRPPTVPASQYAPLGTVATPAQAHAVARESARMAQELRTSVHERAVFIDAEGRTVWQMHGRTVPAYVTNESGQRHLGTAEIAPITTPPKAYQARRVEYLHTHPDYGGSFSKSDVQNATAHHLAGMHAIGRGPDGAMWRYTIRPGPNAGKGGMWSYKGTYQQHAIGKLFDQAEHAVLHGQNGRGGMMRALRQGRMTADQINSSWAHETWKRGFSQLSPGTIVYEAGPIR